jgi:hypothetical protein
LKVADARYALWGLGLAVVAGLPLAAGYAGWRWELSEVAGLAAAIGCIVLAGSPVRPRDASPPILLSLARHEWLGWCVLGGAFAHVALAVAADGSVIEYLKPTLPLYQLAGLVALIGLGLLSVASSAGNRRRLWANHRAFQAVHVIAGCLILPLVVAHVVATDRYSGAGWRRGVLGAVAVFGLLLLLRRRRLPSVATRAGAHAARRLVFGRHTVGVVTAVAMTALGLGLLATGRADLRLREPLLARFEALPLEFDHAKHRPVNCVTCHHNYVDGRGFDACINCHRRDVAHLKVGIEARFHDFCLDCHRHPDPALEHHGPVSGCFACHRADASFH